jgi:NADH dehydrogenase/putative oxidoreductase
MRAALRRAALSALSLVGFASGVAAPWLALLVRLWLAQIVAIAGFVAMMRGPLPGGSGMLAAVAGSGFGVVVQASCPILLALGVLTRPAALALIVQVQLLRIPGVAEDAALYWTALLGWLAVFGAGPISLDRVLARGAESVAVPGAAALLHAADRLTRRLGPLAQLVLRVWLAAELAGLAFAALHVMPSMRPGSAALLPPVPPMVAALAPPAALALAALLATGLATRFAGLLLLLLVPLGAAAMAGDARLSWALLLALPLVHGAGPLSLDALLGRFLRREAAEPDRTKLPHVVIVGGGFGGVAAARGLRACACRVTLIDRRNHQVFQPLLYQVATASLAPGGIATPIRSLFRDQPNARVLLGDVSGVDLTGRAVVSDRGRIPFDFLILASGARHSYFGRDDWAVFAPGLKTIEDATAIRRRLLLAFEEAENATDFEVQRAWLSFVVVGGGPTGVELAGAIAELARHGLHQEFRAIDPAMARIVLVQSGPRLLPTFPEALSREAELALRHLGVDVQTGRRVEMVTPDGVTVSGDVVRARTVLWAAGVMASPASSWLGVEPDRAGRVLVGPDLAVPGCDGVFAIGDTAAAQAWHGEFVPGLAPAAKQGGAYVARVIRSRVAGTAAPLPFRYHHFGSLATIGRQSAVADFGAVRLRGALAWWLWGAAHIAFLVGGRNRAVVIVEWLWAYLTFRRGTRLITEAPIGAPAAPLLKKPSLEISL